MILEIVMRSVLSYQVLMLIMFVPHICELTGLYKVMAMVLIIINICSDPEHKVLVDNC